MIEESYVRAAGRPVLILITCLLLFASCGKSEHEDIPAGDAAALEEAAVEAGSVYDYTLVDGALYENGAKVPYDITELNLTGCQLSDFGFLEDFTALERLFLDDTGFAQLSLLNAMENLYELSLTNCTDITDWTPLAELSGLRSLSLGGTGIEDLSPLANLTELESLSLIDLSGPLDLGILSGLTRLKSLQLYADAELSILGSLPELTQLGINLDHKADLSPLSSLANLRTLTIVNTGGLNLELSPVSGLSELIALSIAGGTADFDSLAGLVNLENLVIWADENSVFEDIAILKDMKKLSGLQLSAGEIENLSEMATYELPELSQAVIIADVDEAVETELRLAFPDCNLTVVNTGAA